MNEESDTPSVAEVVQPASVESLNDELTTKTDKPNEEMKSLNNIRSSTSRVVKFLTTIAQATLNWLVFLVFSTVCFNFKNEIVKYFLALAMNPIAISFNVIGVFLIGKIIKRELESDSMRIENMKITAEDVSTRLKFKLDELNEKTNANIVEIDRFKGESEAKMTAMKNEIKLKTKEIEYLKKLEGVWKTRISELEKELKAAKNGKNLKMFGDVQTGLEKVGKQLGSILDQTTEMTIRARFSEISKLIYVVGMLSQPIEFAGISWRIRLWKTTDGYLAITLKAEKKNATKWSCAVLGEFQLLSQQDDSVVKRFAPEKPLFFNDGQTSLGVRRFIPFEVLLNGDAVKDDSIIVAVSLRVFPTN